jgi:hypothetical protein
VAELARVGRGTDDGDAGGFKKGSQVRDGHEYSMKETGSEGARKLYHPRITPIL